MSHLIAFCSAPYCTVGVGVVWQGELLPATQPLAVRTRLDCPVQPLLMLESRRRVDALRWCPADQNWVATVSAFDSNVHLCDLEYYQARPMRPGVRPPRLPALPCCVYHMRSGATGQLCIGAAVAHPL